MCGVSAAGESLQRRHHVGGRRHVRDLGRDLPGRFPQRVVGQQPDQVGRADRLGLDGQAGAVVAARLSIPAVLQENTLWPAAELFQAVTTSAAFAAHGVADPALTITVTPPSLRATRTPDAVTMRPVPFCGGGSVPDRLLAPGDRPRVLVSRSTLAGPNGGDPGPAVIAAAPQVDADFVLVRPAAVRRLPPNVHTVDRIPLDRALPHATAFIHHAGAGSVLGGLAAGVPQLATPGPGDRRHNAELLAARGAGLAVEAKAIGPADLVRLLTDDTLREAARQVAAEIADMPAPADVVPALQRLAGR